MGVAEEALGQRVHVVAAAAGVEHVGHQHGVVAGRDVDAAQREHLRVELHVLADLEHAAVFQQRLERRERIALGNLVRRKLGREQAGVALAGLAMTERHVAGFVRRDREREAAQLGLHRVEAVGLGVERHDAGRSARAIQCLQPVKRCAWFRIWSGRPCVARTASSAAFGERLRRASASPLTPGCRRAARARFHRARASPGR